MNPGGRRVPDELHAFELGHGQAEAVARTAVGVRGLAVCQDAGRGRGLEIRLADHLAVVEGLVPAAQVLDRGV